MNSLPEEIRDDIKMFWYWVLINPAKQEELKAMHQRWIDIKDEKQHLEKLQNQEELTALSQPMEDIGAEYKALLLGYLQQWIKEEGKTSALKDQMEGIFQQHSLYRAYVSPDQAIAAGGAVALIGGLVMCDVICCGGANTVAAVASGSNAQGVAASAGFLGLDLGLSAVAAGGMAKAGWFSNWS